VPALYVLIAGAICIDLLIFKPPKYFLGLLIMSLGIRFIIFLIKETMANSFFKIISVLTGKQRNGLYVLILVSFVLLIIRLVYPVFIQPDEIVIENLPLTEKKKDSIYAPDRDFVGTNPAFFQRTRNRAFCLRPQYVSLQELIELGFTSKKYGGHTVKFRSWLLLRFKPRKRKIVLKK